jgi:hypothetical protein
MTFFAQRCFHTVRGTGVSGAILGFTLAVAFGAVFALYAILRSSLQIALILSAGEGLWATLAANAFSLLIPILSFTLLLGIVAALLQSMALLLVYGFTALLNPYRSPARAAWIGLITAVILASGVQFAIQRRLGIYFDALWPMGYLFWLGLPSLIFVGATTWISWQLAGHPVNRQIGQLSVAA